MKKKLKDVCDFYSGTGFPTQYQGEIEGDYPFYKVGDIANNATTGKIYLELCNNYISKDIAKTIKGCILPKDTVVFAIIGEALKLNRRAITSCECLIDNNAMGIAPKINQLRIQYFFFFMKNLKMQSLSESTTVPSVRKTKLENYEIEVPSMKAQEEIEKKLALILDIIEKRKQELVGLDSLIKARFVELFENGTYQTEKLGTVCAKITDGTHKTPTYLDEGITFISAKNIVNGELDFSDIKYISEKEYQEIQKRCQTAIYDILLSKSGSLGAPVIVKTEEKLGLFESLAVLKYDREKLLPEFLCEQLKIDRIQRQFTIGTKGVAVKHLHLGVIADTDVIVPPMDEQKQFADFVKQVDKSKVAVQKALDETQLLFDSLMQKYFG